MGRYDGVYCPVCGKAFTEHDDIVVCPVCGAPHHRSCYEKNGECAYVEKHALGEEWRRPKPEIIDGNAPLRCPRCGTINQPDAVFCELCGASLNTPGAEAARPAASVQQGSSSPVFVMPYNAYTTPYGGLSPDEELEGIPVKDIAMFVGSGSYYYLPRFKDMTKSGRKLSWNWAAFLGNALYFCGRRMYMVGALLVAFFIIRLIPTIMFNYHVLEANLDLIIKNPYALFSADVPPASRYWAGITQILNYIYWAGSVLLGAFANKLYQRHVFSSIRELRQTHKEQQGYYEALRKKGGLNMGLIIGLVVAFFLVSFLVVGLIQAYLLLPALSR